jgi:predicted  nucleic acid-binding Zn-ribbon protein
MTETAGEIETVQSKIEDTQAVLAQLYSKKGELETSKAKLEADISETKTQIAQATEKRSEEHVNFVKEQTDFDNAISSCEKAVTLLAAHYGDGSGPAEAVKPEFMSLMETIRKSVRALRVPLGTRQKGMSFLQDAKPGLRSALSFLQGTQPNNDRYQAATGEATTIVDQIKVLGQTFAEDKQSAISEEERLQATYDNLMDEKSQLLTGLQTGDVDCASIKLADR